MIVLKVIAVLMLLSVLIGFIPINGKGHGFKERTRYVSPEKKKEMFEKEFHKFRR